MWPRNKFWTNEAILLQLSSHLQRYSPAFVKLGSGTKLMLNNTLSLYIFTLEKEFSSDRTNKLTASSNAIQTREDCRHNETSISKVLLWLMTSLFQKLLSISHNIVVYIKYVFLNEHKPSTAARSRTSGVPRSIYEYFYWNIHV